MTSAFFATLAGSSVLAIAALAACVGDDPIDSATTSSSGDATSSSGSSGAGSSGSSGAGSSGQSSGNGSSGTATSSSSGGGDTDAGVDAGPPTGTALWGTSFDFGPNPNRPHAADARGGKRVLARSLEFQGNDSTTLQVQWFAHDGLVERTKVFTSTQPIFATGVRFDDAGNVYLSLLFSESVSSDGVEAVAAVPTDGTSPAGTKCGVLRLGANNGAIAWKRTFYATLNNGAGIAAGVHAPCRVSRIRSVGASSRVLVSGGFSGPALYSLPGAGPRQGARDPARFAGAPMDGFVTLLDANDGAIKGLASFGADGDLLNPRSVEIDDAAFLNDTKILVVGGSTSKTITRADSEQVLVDTPSLGPSDVSSAGFVITADLNDPPASLGESWHANPDSGVNSPREARVTSVVGRGNQYALVAFAYSKYLATFSIPNVLTPIPLTTTGRQVAVGVNAAGARQAWVLPRSPSGAQSLMRMDDGRVALATTSPGPVDFGAACSSGGSVAGTTLAFFTDATLATCTHSASFTAAFPLGLTGGDSVVLLSGKTNQAVDFGDFDVPQNAAPQGFAVEFAP